MALLTLITLLAMVVPAGEIFQPETIYYDSRNPGRTVLYPEGFMARRGEFTSIDGAREWAMDPSADSLSVCGNKLALHNVGVNPDAIPSDCAATVLCFGESTTEIRCKDPHNPRGKAMNWVEMAAQELPKGVRLVGNIGHGGWSTYTYLNWPCAAKLDPNTPPSFFKPRTMWYALGLKSATGQDFDGSREQLSMMVLTPFGFHPMDGDKQLWELVQLLGKRNGYPAFDCDEAYDGSKRQLDMLRDWADMLMDNPINEFYDRKTAAKGHHAFNLKAYTRQKPTHAVINIGINDGDGANSLESSLECYRRLIDCFDGIVVAHFVNRWPGVCHIGSWDAEYIPRQYDVNGNTWNLLRLQKLWRQEAAARPDLYELDVWHVQSPVSQLEEKMAPDGRLDCSKNDVHTGYEGIKSTAHQVACWLIHILSK